MDTAKKKKKTNFNGIVDAVLSIAGSQTVQKLVLGEYSDGSTRSLGDCLDGELLSPKDRQKALTKQGKKKGKKGKKKKAGKIKL